MSAVKAGDHFKRILLAAVLAAAAAAVGASPTAAGDTRCGKVPPNPDLEPAPTPEYFDNFEFLIGGMYDNLVVPKGTWCFALGVTVHGNVLVSGAGSKLNVGSDVFGSGGPSVIGGNVDAKRGAHVNVFLSIIHGNYTCDGCLYLGSIENHIGGNVQASRAQTGADVWNTAIGGNLQLTKNAGPITVFDNTIAGNLECSRNSPAAVNSGNTADASKGECAA